MRQLPRHRAREAGRLLRLLLVWVGPLSPDAVGRRRLLRERILMRTLRWQDGAGVLGALFAAFCCAGAPVIVTALAAPGLSALRRDSILWPLMLLSL